MSEEQIKQEIEEMFNDLFKSEEPEEPEKPRTKKRKGSGNVAYIEKSLTPEMLSKARIKLLGDLKVYRNALVEFQRTTKDLTVYRYTEGSINQLIDRASSLEIMLNGLERSNMVSEISSMDYENQLAQITELLISIYMEHIGDEE